DEFEVHVCALTRGGPLLPEFQAAGVPVTVLGKAWKFDPVALWRLRQFVARLGPDLVHTWIFAANAYGRAAGILAGVRCLVAGERCVDPWKGPIELAIDRWLARRTACLVGNSPGVRDFYVSRGLPAERFEVIPNGIAPAAPPVASRREVLASLGLPETARIAALVGRLWPQKRVRDAIWATDLMRVFPYDFHLVILGDGPQRDRLEQFRDQVEVHDKVHFLGQRDDVHQILPHCDVLWSPSAFEGQSNAIMEAMAAGVPVVATDIPGTRDLVVDGETGFLVPTPDRPAESATINDAVAR
ncbi:MAG: glycosyltransferase, partial [Thermoguttaceae bacterium]|nr:glycosyltransferase [Thermoguttaceae bacterium]